MPLLPTTENILIYFAVFLAKTVNPDTIKVYLAAVRHMRGIKRVKGVSTRTRLPITLDHLKLFHRILHSRTSPTHDETMIWAAISIAFFGFLRIGEMTCSGPYNSSTNLCRSDVSFHPAHYAGRSFRIGAATTAASQGLPHWLIQTLGRWSSDCYLRYIRTPINVLTDVSKRLIAE